MAAPIKVMMLRNLSYLLFKTNLRQDVCQRCSVHLSSSVLTPPTEKKHPDSTVQEKPTDSTVQEKQKISKAMQSYLVTVKEHKDRMAQLTDEYKRGEKHLAEIMGIEPKNFTEKDKREALAYLMPSGLTDKKARPALMTAEEVIPIKKAPQIGLDGRPFHYLFYTGRPKYYALMHDCAMKAEALREKQINRRISGVVTETSSEDQKEQQLSIRNSEWISKASLEEKLSEELNEKDYKSFCSLMDHLLDQPMSDTEYEFIMSYRKVRMSAISFGPKQTGLDLSSNVCFESQGSRKRAKCTLKLYSPGTGKIDIEGQDISYFKSMAEREQVMFPLQLTNSLGKFDLEIKLNGEGGPSGQAGAIRYALSTALINVVSQEDAIKMRIAGLLTADPRRRERKKPGQEGARKKYTWKKR